MTGAAPGPRHCASCGAAHSGGRWCTQCGASLGVATPVPGPPRARVLPVVLVVLGVLVLGAVSFVGARWWLADDDQDAAPPSTPAAAETSSTGTRHAKVVESSGLPAEPTPTPAAVTVTATVTSGSTTVVPPIPSATPPPITTTPTTTASTVDTIAGVRRHDIDCDQSYVVVLGSALDRTAFADTASALTAKYPGTNYLISGSSCFNFRSQSAYVLYEGPYATLGTACAARLAGTRDAYVKVADRGATDRTVSCLCPAGVAPPDLGAGDKNPYVAEAQYALQRLGFYGGDGTGVFDADTEAAVQGFQTATSLPPDGRLTATAWPALIAADCTG